MCVQQQRNAEMQRVVIKYLCIQAHGLPSVLLSNILSPIDSLECTISIIIPRDDTSKVVHICSKVLLVLLIFFHARFKLSRSLDEVQLCYKATLLV